MASKAGAPGAKRARPRSGTMGTRSSTSPVFSTPESPTMFSSMQRLLDVQTEQINGKIRDRIKELEQKIDQKVTELITSINFNATSIDKLQKEVIPSMQRTIEEDRQNTHDELDKVNAYICRENLVFIGVPEAQNEEVETVLAKLLVEKLKIPREEVDQIEYQRAHRLPAATRPRPIKARFLKFKERDMVLRNAKHLKGSPIYITEDLPRRVRRERQLQLPALKAARSAGKLAYFSRQEPWKLYVDRVFLPKAEQESFVDKLRRRDGRIQLLIGSAKNTRPNVPEQQQAEGGEMEIDANKEN